jgi:hypothetical protein
MKERYPSLYWWKQEDFKKFPIIPFDQIIDALEKTFMQCISDHVNDVDNISINKTPISTPSQFSLMELERRLVLTINRSLSRDKIKDIDEATETAMRRLKYLIQSVPGRPLWSLLHDFVKYEIKKLVHEQWITWGEIVGEAREKIIMGESRASVLRELGDKVLPQTRGGPSIFTRDELETLRFIYGEMMLCIREIRQSLDLPLKVRTLTNDDYIREHFVGEDPVLYAKDGIPEITGIFKDNEISIILANKRTSDISAEIILNRLKKCRSSKITSPRTMKDILYSITSTFTE